MVGDVRSCEQCGISFEPRREHARFCSPRCRVSWNREHADSKGTEATALGWSITAMRDITGRLRRVRAADRQQAFAVISEAVWWVTMVDGTLVRYHPGAYDRAMAAQPVADRRRVEGTLGGLRFVRNRMGYHLDPADVIETQGPGSAERGGITAWRWRPLAVPVLGSLPPRGREWEMSRYRAYQAELAGHTIGETFRRASAFLDRVYELGGLAVTATERASL